jgi:hypothetical protein
MARFARLKFPDLLAQNSPIALAATMGKIDLRFAQLYEVS